MGAAFVAWELTGQAAGFTFSGHTEMGAVGVSKKLLAIFLFFSTRLVLCPPARIAALRPKAKPEFAPESGEPCGGLQVIIT